METNEDQVTGVKRKRDLETKNEEPVTSQKIGPVGP